MFNEFFNGTALILCSVFLRTQWGEVCNFSQDELHYQDCMDFPTSVCGVISPGGGFPNSV